MPVSTIYATRIACVLTIAGGLYIQTTPARADAGHARGASIGEPAKASAATRSINVKLADSFYEPKTLQVKAGETVRFVLTNTGELLHEFNLGTAEMHAEHQKQMLEMAEAGLLTATDIVTDHAKMDHSKMGGKPMSHDDPNAVLLRPGEKKELVWKFTKAAELEFACNLPGHYESGMVGKVEFRR